MAHNQMQFQQICLKAGLKLKQCRCSEGGFAR